MEKFLEEILKSELLSEDTKKEMRKQFGVFVEGVRDQAKKELAEQYKKDRERLINATDKMITESIKSNLNEFAEEFKNLDRLKQKASKAIVEADKKANQKVGKAITFLESKLTNALGDELKDFVEDRKVERQAVMSTIKEAKERSEREHQEFVKKGAKMIDYIIEKEVKTLLKSLHKDIIAARQNNFGRKIFEAYVSEFENSLFSHDVHSKKLKTTVESTQKKYNQLKESARAEIVRLRKETADKNSQIIQLKETTERSVKTARLLKNLRGESREQMRNLLESAPVGKLESTFKKFLPVVTETKQNAPTRKERPLQSLHTGDKRTLTEAAQGDDETDEDIVLLQRRAGLKK